MRLSFGRCVLDTETRELTVGGVPVHLTRKLFELLTLLLEQHPRAISKAELHQRLWPGIFVSESALSSLVADLRSAMGDDAHGSGLIRTVHGHGYAFAGQVSSLPDFIAPGAPAYRLLWDQREIALREGENIIGRTHDAVVWIDDPAVSRRHARITVRGTAMLADLGSKNGTLLNGRRIETEVVLSDGDTITLGPATLVFRAFRAEGSTLTGHGVGGLEPHTENPS